MREQGKAHVGRGTQAAALAVGLAAALGAGATAWAAAPHTFGMVGLGHSQTAFLHAVLTQPPDPAHPGCRVTLSFVDARGQVYRNRAGTEFKETFILRDNVSATLRMRAADILATGELRKLIRGVVSYPPETEGASQCASLMATEELMLPTGWSSILESVGEPCPGDPGPPSPLAPCPSLAIPR